MSLILDALNRSRGDAQPVPGLASQTSSEYQDDGAKRVLLPWIILLLLAPLVLWLLWERLAGGAATPAEVSGPAAIQTATPEKATAASPATARTVSAAPATPAVSQPVASAPSPPVKAPDPVVVAAQKTQKTMPSPDRLARAERNADAVAKLYAQSRQQPPAERRAPETAPLSQAATPSASRESQTPAAGNTKRTETPLDLAAMLDQAREEMRNAKLQEHSAPFITRLSQSSKDAIPSLLYERHDYSSTRGRSRVVINGKTLAEGGSAANGVRVEEILPQSVVLSHKGTQFRLRALNSWVNL